MFSTESPISLFDFLTWSPREDLYLARSNLVRSVCLNHYSVLFNNRTRDYERRQRHDAKHNFVYCENYKVASTTWSTYLLKLAGANYSDFRESHLLTKDLYRPLIGPRRKAAMLRRSVKFLIVRDPFQRLWSAFKDKVERPPRSPSVKYFYGLHHTLVARSRNSGRTLFHEFVQYLVQEYLGRDDRETADKIRRMNNHFKPFHANCGVCTFQYDVVAKLETYSADESYIFEKCRLNETVLGGIGGQVVLNRNPSATDDDGDKRAAAAVGHFADLDRALLRKLYQIYKFDFLMFNYDASVYLD